MNLDNFTRHLAAVTVAVLALGFSGAAIYLFVIGKPVPALLASLASGTTGYLLPSPLQTGRVTVENDPSDPVPTSAVKAKERGAVDLLTVAVVLLIAVAAIYLGLAVHPLLLLLLLLIVVVLISA